VIEQRGDRDHADVQQPLPPERALHARCRTQAEDAEVPDGERRGQIGEEEIALALTLRGQRAPEEQQVEAQREERQELMREHPSPTA
jgi:hypothetical protein